VRRAAAVAAGYVAVAAATIAVAGPRVLPLFDSFKPPEPYHWVSPPPPYGPGNQVPAPQVVTQDIGASLGLTTPDGQCTVSLAAGSIAASGSDTRVEARLAPLAAGAVGPLPAGAHADGNAYRVELLGEPSGRTMTDLAAPGHLVLKGVVPVRSVLYSADGRTWSSLPSQAVGDPTVAGALFSRTGVYLAASATDPASLPARRSGGAGTLAVSLSVAALAGVVLLGPGGVRRVAGRR
jgi:hypothetical protein